MAAWILASWGNPLQWREAEYILDSGVGSPSRVSRTTLPLLLEAHGAEGATVIVPDSVAVASISQNGCVPRGYKPLSSASSYSEIVEAARGVVEDWVRECAGLSPERLRIVVAPAVGFYRAGRDGPYLRAVYPAILKAAPAEAYWALAALEALRAVARAGGRLVVDVSHGLNYMPMELYSAAVYSASLYSMAEGRGTVVTVYNSEPYPVGYVEGPPPELHVHLVDERRLAPRQAAIVALQYASGRLDRVKLTRQAGRLEAGLQERLNEVNSRAQEAWRKGSLALGALLASAPLALGLVEDAGDVRALVEETLEVQREAAKVSPLGGGVLVEHRVAVKRREAAAVLLAGHAVAAARRLAPETVYRGDAVCASIDALYSIVDAIPFPNSIVAKHEVSSLRRKCVGGEGECPLKRLSCHECRDVNDRNFYAHAGLESNVTALEGSMVCYPKACIGVVRHVLETLVGQLLGLHE